jgi:hypothetical protein
MSIRKSVPNLINYLHEFFQNFSQSPAICFELISFGVIFNSEIADKRVLLVSRRAPHRARGIKRCVKTAVTAAVVTENVCGSRRWKAESVAYGICKQLSSSFVHLRLLKPDRSPVCTVCPESFQHLVLTSKSHSYQTVHRNTLYE